MFSHRRGNAVLCVPKLEDLFFKIKKIKEELNTATALKNMRLTEDKDSFDIKLQ